MYGKINSPIYSSENKWRQRYYESNSYDYYIPNVSLNRFQFTIALPEGYEIDPNDITENDIKIFNAAKDVLSADSVGELKKKIEGNGESWHNTRGGYYRLYNDEELEVLNKHIKFKIATDSDETARMPIISGESKTFPGFGYGNWDGHENGRENYENGSRPYYIYLASVTDENNELVNLLIKNNPGFVPRGGYSVQYDDLPRLFYPDIRINPNKVKKISDKTPYLKEGKALKTSDKSDYKATGDISKLENSDFWLSLVSGGIVPGVENFGVKVDALTPVEQIDTPKLINFRPSHLFMYVIPNKYTIDGKNYQSLAWQYRIMDRADYTWITPSKVFEPIPNTDFYLMHSYKNLNANADQTTGVAKRPGVYLTPEDGVIPPTSEIDSNVKIFTHRRYLWKLYDDSVVSGSNKQEDRATTLISHLNFESPNYILQKAFEGVDNSWKARQNFRDIYLNDGRAVPIREITSGHFEQDEYNENNKDGRTIPGSKLLEIAKNAKRKGYRVAGFSRGKNLSTLHYGDLTVNGETQQYLMDTYTAILSDMLPYEGVDDFGKPVSWKINWNNNVMDEESEVFTKGITLGLTDARVYRDYIYPTGGDALAYSNKESLTDWFNTTYIYLVWEPDPDSIYYNKTQAGDIGSFVAIPGDLEWPGYRNPYFDNGTALTYVNFGGKYRTKESGYSYTGVEDGTNDALLQISVGRSFFNEGQVSTYDFSISDKEVHAGLFETVYNWAIKNGYDFTSNSSATYIPVNRSTSESYNSYDATVKDGVIKEETTSFDLSKIYGGIKTLTSGEINDGHHTTYDYYAYKPIEDGINTDFKGNKINGTFVKGNHPATYINIVDAMLFCNALTDYSNANLGTNFEKAYGNITKYSDMKRIVYNSGEILRSQTRNGYRLPSYNEWFAAASIVPYTLDSNIYNNISIPAGVCSYDNYLSGNVYGRKYYYVGTDGSKIYSPVLTSYPFMQDLTSYSGVYSNGEMYPEQYVYSRFSGSSTPNVSTTRDIIANDSNFKPNSLGLYDMSGSVAEWTIGVPSFIGDPDGSGIKNFADRVIISIPGGDWTGPIDDGKLSQQLLSNNGSSKSYSAGLPKNDRLYDGYNNMYNNNHPGVNFNVLSYGQRVPNIGFRVCRTIKDSTV